MFGIHLSEWQTMKTKTMPRLILARFTSWGRFYESDVGRTLWTKLNLVTHIPTHFVIMTLPPWLWNAFKSKITCIVHNSQMCLYPCIVFMEIWPQFKEKMCPQSFRPKWRFLKSIPETAGPELRTASSSALRSGRCSNLWTMLLFWKYFYKYVIGKMAF
jgi:hypothetical protein